MDIGLVVGTEIALLLITGLVVGRAAGRATAAWMLTLACVLLPWSLPSSPAWIRAALALASLLAVFRTVEITHRPEKAPWPVRVAAYVTPSDVFAARAAPPRFEGRAFAAALAYAGLAGVGWALVLEAPAGLARWPVAALGGAIGMYATVDASDAVSRATFRLFGIDVPAVQRSPIAARSVAELWSRRWNRWVGAWLRRHFFAPLARRGHPRLGIAAAFGVSAAIHFWPIYVSIGLAPALVMAAFFMTQAGLVAVEARLPLSRAPERAQRVWTIGAVGLSTPLFVVPLLLALGFR